MKLNLGSGNDYKEGYVNIDISKTVKPDIVLDISNEPLPFEDDSCEIIEAIDFFEHILYPIPVLNECWRVLKKNGLIIIEVPMAGTNDFYKDPTHVRPFVPETFKYFADYADSYKAINCKPWIIAAISNTDNRIFVQMRPKK
jgi:predicted SAM-dependent methyltransferase